LCEHIGIINELVIDTEQFSVKACIVEGKEYLIDDGVTERIACKPDNS
jgi:hypothetical protein